MSLCQPFFTALHRSSSPDAHVNKSAIVLTTATACVAGQLCKKTTVRARCVLAAAYRLHRPPKGILLLEANSKSIAISNHAMSLRYNLQERSVVPFGAFGAVYGNIGKAICSHTCYAFDTFIDLNWRRPKNGTE